MIYIIEMIDNLNEVEQDGPKQDGSILRVKSLTTMGPQAQNGYSGGPKWEGPNWNIKIEFYVSMELASSA